MTFSTSLLAVLPLFALSARETASSEQMTIAATLAHAKATSLESEPLDALADGKDQIGSGPTAFLRTWEVQSDTPHAGLTTVVVRVKPLNERNGANTVATVDLLRDR